MSPFRVIRTSLLVVAAAFAGCAQLPDGKSGLDPDGLHNAIVADRVDYVKAAIEKGVSVNERIPAPAYAEGTPLITIAARAGSLEVIRYLILAGADINARTPVNETPLMLATYFYGTERGGAAPEKHEKAARLLVESGAQLENPNNYTPLSYAAYQGHEKLVGYLLSKGARVDGDATNNMTYVNTPLMMASMQGHDRVALMLLRAGANAKVRVHEGHTAAELAERHLGRSLLGFLRCAEQLAPQESFSSRCEGSVRTRAIGAGAAALQPVNLER